MSYLISEGIIDTAALYILLKKIITPFEQWDAYKLGIIDKDGNKIKKPISSKERDSWDLLDRFACNFKKLIIRFIGKSNFVTYFTIAVLLKDSINYFYINHNKEKLHEQYLYDFDIIKQNQIYNIIKKLPKIDHKNINEETFVYYYYLIEKELNTIENINDVIYSILL